MRMIIFLFLLMMCLIAEADNKNKKVGTTGGQFLKLGVGAKELSLAEAAGVLHNLPTCIYYNPGGISRLKNFAATTMYTMWLEDTGFGFLGISFPVTSKSTLGAAATYLQVRNIEGRSRRDQPVKLFSAHDYAIHLSLGYSISENLSIGMAVKYIETAIKDRKANTFTVDVGEVYNPHILPNLYFGFVVQNITGNIKFIQKEYPLPLIVGAMVAYKFDSPTINIYFRMNNYNDKEPTYHFGIEYSFKNIAYLRGGYSNAYSSSSPGLALGAGVRIKRYYIDYAFLPFDENLKDMHRISFSLNFGEEK